MMADSDQSRGSFVNKNALAFLVKETIRKFFFKAATDLEGKHKKTNKKKTP